MKFIFTLASSVVFLLTAPIALAGDSWVAHCQARNEVHEVQSRGQCQAHFKLNSDGDGLEYKVLASNLEFVTQSHIHMAPAGQNGPVVAFLFGFVAEGVNPNGLLAQGIITDADLIGPLAGMTIYDLLDAMDAGNTYVNVHTQAYPPGEVRGQIK